MSDTEKLIEAAERWAKNVSESPGNGTAGEDLYGARLLISLAAALRETTAREEAAELDAAQLRAAFKVAGHTSLAEEMRKGLTTAFELAKVARERDALAAANVAANKRIVALEHERDAARAALARLTTPRPIAEAPRDGSRGSAMAPALSTYCDVGPAAGLVHGHWRDRQYDVRLVHLGAYQTASAHCWARARCAGSTTAITPRTTDPHEQKGLAL